MPSNRRNYYRILHVQPDAPMEVIRACYRTLMSTLRHHPDLGGDHETAAVINEAYATLSDDAKRAAYDAARTARLKRGAPRVDRRTRTSQDAAAETPLAASAPAAASYDGPRCSFCRHPAPARVARNTRCTSCRAPLAPLVRSQASSARADRRGMPRVSKTDWALVHLGPRGEGFDVRLRDLSLDGISFFSGIELPLGLRVRVVGSSLDVVAEVVSSRKAGNVFTVHAHLLTAQFARAGAFVRAVA